MNLENLNVQELNINEMKNIDGGVWQFLLGYLAGKLIDAFINDPGSFGDTYDPNGWGGGHGGGRP